MCVNVENYFKEKSQIDDSFDIVIEIISFSAPQKLEGALATSFNISDEPQGGSDNNVNRRTAMKIKNIKQEILIENEKKWFTMNDVFGVPGESTR